MDVIAYVWALVVSGLAYWLGLRTGWRQATTGTALLFWNLGVRSVDSDSKTITFRDGTTRTERGP